MTICIAAFAENETSIVITADSKVAFGDFSTDQGALKYELLGQRYLALIAGNDVVYALPTINRIKAEMLKTQIGSADEVAEIVYDQLCETRNKIIEAKVLKRYKLTVEQFINKGKKSFTDQVYYDICSRIDRENLSLQFLVVGFDALDKPHLRIVSAEEPPHDYDSLGFAAIGTGAPAALASLSFAKDHCSFARHCDLEEAAYFVLSAKFMSESATDVGKETFLMSISAKRGVHHLYDMGAIDTIRQNWLKHGAPQRSIHSIKIIKEVLYSAKEGFFNSVVMERVIKYVKPSLKKSMRILIEAAKRRELAQAEQKKLS